MASFLDHVGQQIYENLIEKNKGIDIFTLLDVWGYLIEVAKGDKRVAGCVLKIERKGDHYDISQLMVNKRGEALYSKGEFVLGHIWQAYDLDDDLYAIAKSRKLTKMTLEALKLKVDNREMEEDE